MPDIPTERLEQMRDGCGSECEANADEGSAMAGEVLGARQAVSRAKEEVLGVLEAMPPDSVVRVHEGGGPEDIYASLAVSVLKLAGQVKSLADGSVMQELVRHAEAAEKERDRLAKLIPTECCEGADPQCHGPRGCLVRAQEADQTPGDVLLTRAEQAESRTRALEGALEQIASTEKRGDATDLELLVEYKILARTTLHHGADCGTCDGSGAIESEHSEAEGGPSYESCPECVVREPSVREESDDTERKETPDE